MRFISILLIVLALAAGCQPPATPTPERSAQAAQTIDLVVDPSPPAVGDASLIVTVTRDSAPLADAPVSVRGDMNHAGMRPVLGDATTAADGTATIPFNWTMGGDWVVTVTVTLPDGSEVSQQFDQSVQT
ncbi:MAG: FixH family protein [Anaerolineae bacterium]